MRFTGVTARGILTPIFKSGDNLAADITQSVVSASKNEDFQLNDGDIVGVTEAVVARTQGNYATCDQIAADVSAKFGDEPLGLLFPILSRNRFSLLLKSFALASKKIYIQLSFPADEVGNSLLSSEQLYEKGVSLNTNFTENEFRAVFGNETIHPFTGVDYIDFYKSFGSDIEIIFSNDPTYILNYTKNVLNCDIHTRTLTQKRLLAAGAKRSFRLDQILTESIDGSGYNAMYGLLGSNKATELSVKLFPRDCDPFVAELQRTLYEVTGKNMEVMIYGDGGFKDPVGGIWELADPVVSPAFTSGLSGTPNELKMKYFADNEFSELRGDALAAAMKKRILEKENSLVGNMTAEGTTPRRYTDLIGSLCDLISGSGDRGTPVVLIQGYFNNFASN